MREKLVDIGTILLLIGYFLLSGSFTPPADFGDPMTIWFIRIGLYAIGIGAILLLFQRRMKKKRESEKASSLYLMQYGRKIPVSKDAVVIKEVKTEPATYLLCYEGTTGKCYMSREINLSREEISLRLSKEAEIHLYEDQRNSAKYFFNVDFLKD
ncbi:MAG: hypothetical protein JST26_19635 [Bacteroidetes bacterium]|nr:hypothetical protein [Bacteroidota bacterium]